MTASAKVQELPLLEIIRDKIEREGPISIADYMQLCLTHYYATRDPLGSLGDFTTAPEISQMFGEVIGAYMAERWQAMGQPSPFHLIECGPGRGTLMKDVLRVMQRVLLVMQRVPALLEALQIHLVETSFVLQEIQAKTLKDFKVTWHGSFGDVPQGAFALIANEFLDALPIRQFFLADGREEERFVGMKNGRLFFTGEEAGGDIIERSPPRENFVRQICARLKRDKGFALLIDYGSEKSGFGDTLQAVRGHEFADPLENPGEQDLTSQVDFETLMKIAKNEGLRGELATQGNFLLSLGIKERAQILQKENPGKDIGADLQRLTAPKQMGELFKVMTISS